MKYRVLKIITLLLTFCSYQLVLPCSIIIGHKKGKVLVGNNEDWFNSDSKYWIEEPDKKKDEYKACFFGFNGEGKYAQGGMNEHGLFFDGTYVSKTPVDRDLVREKGLKAASIWVFKRVLKEKRNVPEAYEELKKYFYPFIKSAQIVFVDSQGEYLVVKTNGISERGTVTEGNFKVITNFHLSELEDQSYSCYRYDLAFEYLSNDLKNTVSQFEDVMSLTHQEYPAATVYTNIFDLQNKSIHLYYNYDFNNAHEIDMLNASVKEHTIENGIFKPRMIDQLIKVYKKDGLNAVFTYYNSIDGLDGEYIKDTQQLIDFSEYLFQKSAWEDYFSVLSQTQKWDPNNFKVYNALGRYSLRQGNINEAIAAYKASLALKSDTNWWAEEMLKQYTTELDQCNALIEVINYSSAQKVQIAGEFNEWMPMRNVARLNNDTWQTCVRAKKGIYKYVVFVDGEKIKINGQEVNTISIND